MVNFINGLWHIQFYGTQKRATMINREITKHLLKLATWFPVVGITGPRQSGKTTLARAAFPNFTYVNLENTNTRIEAIEDPMGFIENRPSNLIIDEAQIAPSLFSAIQVVSDRVGSPGQYVLSGSQNFLLSKNIKQSLAGRCAYANLLPLSFKETKSALKNVDAFNFAVQGGYPRIYDVGIPQKHYYQAYIRTYVERDVQGYLDVRNLIEYKKLIKVLAHQASNLLNITALSNACDIATNTTKSWLSMLQSSYIVLTLQPYFANSKKRLTKTPKLYFYDTGLLCYLLGINTAQDLKLSPYKGAVMENLIICETIKNHLNAGSTPELYFYRDDSKIEIDLLDFTDKQNKKAIEVKAGSLYNKKYAQHLVSTAASIGVKPENQYVVMNAEHSFSAEGVSVKSFEDYLLFA